MARRNITSLGREGAGGWDAAVPSSCGVSFCRARLFWSMRRPAAPLRVRGDSPRTILRGRAPSVSESSKGCGRFGELPDCVFGFGGVGCAGGGTSMVGIGTGLGLVCVAGDIMTRTALGSKLGATKRCENRASVGSSRKCSLIRASSFMMPVSSPKRDSNSWKKANRGFALATVSGFDSSFATVCSNITRASTLY